MLRSFIYKYSYLFLAVIFTLQCEAKLPELTANDVTIKAQEIMETHASHKNLSPELAERILQNYLDLSDPSKLYFIESDIHAWVHPSDELLNQIVLDYNQKRFTVFNQIHESLAKAIVRRQNIEAKIDMENLPTDVKSEEFKNLSWALNEEDLSNRLQRIKSLQKQSASKLTEEMQEKAFQRMTKHRTKFEDEALTKDSVARERLVLSRILKATAASLDSNTVYFTPEEATQFMIHVQQRLFGIGAQLRDDINGFTVVKMVEGGPAALGKELKNKDRIIAVDGEPVVGMDIVDAVELIRGKENTPVILTVIRENITEKGEKGEQSLDITVMRGEVVLKETRYKSSYEPYGNGAIGYLKLFSFYQDQENSSADDLRGEIEKLKKEHNLLGVVLDLRYNSGGLLTQAVDVSGLFVRKGIIVSVKDDQGHVQHLRHLDNNIAWDGPLIILVNRASASASEIVAQTLFDYGRALIVGDDRTYGKGSYQTFTLNATVNDDVNPQGEYKVTRGRYYTVSGRTPQLTGIASQIVVPGPISQEEVGEKFSKYPLENDHISPNFKDDLSDVPFLQRDRVRRMYRFGLQERLETYTPYLESLKTNSEQRLSQCANFQNFLNEINKKEPFEAEKIEQFGQNDLQLDETYHIMKDLLILMQSKGIPLSNAQEEIVVDRQAPEVP